MNGHPDPNFQPPDVFSPGSGLDQMVIAARKGDARAWNALYERFTPLVDAIGRQYRLSPADVDDVRQFVWLRLLENLAGLREVRALPGWLKTTTRNEALRLLKERRRTQPVDPSALVTLELRDPEEGLDRGLLQAERTRALVDGLAELSPEHRRLLLLLHAEPRASYQEIGRTLGMPSGSIGPTRARCLRRLGRTAAIRSLMSVDGPERLAAA
jgi:RNA polymerase sigma factor (sigma-70 family)